ncbi:hypothetical protein GOBAR_AA10984 [Gossypium barbadense]|uniref:Uncharacterized protein n=1 Tax=Gossypium barbadense TaxID=3634 RepID=A0A2P5Y231_GOSBA|nr:hypothetical protein GOBAR_AA10984 [Gossypium barbadense]
MSALIAGRFLLTFALGAGPVPGLLLPEIFLNRIWAKAMAFCMLVHWQLGPQLLYLIFASVCMMEEFDNKVTKLQQGATRTL